jgi:predicted DNA-binding transcriptional regulator AlpA
MTNEEQRPWRATAKAVEGDTLSPDSTAPSPPPQDPEAAELPPGVRLLADTLEKLADTLPGLKAALDRQADRGPEPLAYRKADAARLCGMSARTWERLLSAGKAPRPDAYAGKCPLWKKSTLEAWIARGGSK